MELTSAYARPCRASDKCQREKRKTINGDDLLWAMSTLGFEDYVEPLKAYLHRFREVRKDVQAYEKELPRSGGPKLTMCAGCKCSLPRWRERKPTRGSLAMKRAVVRSRILKAIAITRKDLVSGRESRCFRRLFAGNEWKADRTSDFYEWAQRTTGMSYVLHRMVPCK